MRSWANDFLLAVSYFTRLPVTALTQFSETALRRSTAWFPFIGWLVAGVSATVFLLAAQVLPSELAVLLAMIASILFTGAFHEDGLADTADGFGPVGDRDKALAAMKDSRLGVFAALALGLVLAGKFLALNALIDPLQVATALLVAHPLSRLLVVAVIVSQPYLQQAASRARSAAEGMPPIGWLAALPAGLLPLFLFLPWQAALTALLVAVAVAALITLACRRRFGGYTGDVLGAIQQLTELAILITLTATLAGQGG